MSLALHLSRITFHVSPRGNAAPVSSRLVSGMARGLPAASFSPFSRRAFSLFPAVRSLFFLPDCVCPCESVLNVRGRT